MADEQTYTEPQITRRLADELPHWRLANGCLTRRYKTHGWKATLMVVNTIGHLAEAAFHHPELEVAYAAVTVNLVTHSAGGVTDKDFELATKIEHVVHWRPGEEGGSLEGTPENPRFAYIDYEG